MKRRTGATLVEVLVAIFVMGVGLLALLTLFPIGILTMAQAIQNDRTAHSADNADSLAQARDLRKDTFFPPGTPLANIDFFKNPNPGSNLTDARADLPSWAIYVDPIGFQSFATANTVNWVGGQTTGIRRVPASYVFVKRNVAGKFVDVIDTPSILRSFTLLDDIVFNLNGQADQFSPGLFKRSNIYTWAYLLHRPAYGQPGIVNMHVVVYDDRPTVMNFDRQAGEALFYNQAQFRPADNVITVTWDPTVGQQPPNLRLGEWVLDSTDVKVGKDAKGNDLYGPSHAKFYRVVGITQTSGNTADLEVEQQINATAPFLGSIVVLDGVAEVYEMGTGNRP